MRAPEARSWNPISFSRSSKPQSGGVSAPTSMACVVTLKVGEQPPDLTIEHADELAPFRDCEPTLQVADFPRISHPVHTGRSTHSSDPSTAAECAVQNEATKKCNLAEQYQLAGAGGIEPPNGGIKIDYSMISRRIWKKRPKPGLAISTDWRSFPNEKQHSAGLVPANLGGRTAPTRSRASASGASA